ncbi:Scr1 family TA system antitoxin-like transcriptional regulator [Plantactinospora sp. B6F1]|uniref:Scr1 family TA system antitoxin-like transcriptional regulator n=1 Tax=Plantactinospora sp. B6F1 TaxID=3158971 RepID=UPI0032D8B947
MQTRGHRSRPWPAAPGPARAARHEPGAGRRAPEPGPVGTRPLGSFWLFRMPKPYPEVAYLESLAGQMYFELPKAAKYVSAYDRLREAALGPRESAQLIRTIAEDLA